MNILDTILDAKRQEIKHIKDVKIQKIQPRSLKQALSSSGISVIAEIKMKSPSEGDIFPNADPVQIAKEYESAGASAISVLTDEQFFGGSLDILTAVRKAVSIPVIRKDFIIDEKQILETVHHQADAFLLIADA
jgi:indole-3-glycerol phosphate synthase